MSKHYLKEDFNISDDRKDLFEVQTSEKIQHQCITDEVGKIVTINEFGFSEDLNKLTEIVIGLVKYIPLQQQNIYTK